MIKKFILMSFGSWINVLLGIGSTIIMARMFSTTELGQYNFFMLIIMLFANIFTLGMLNSYIRYFYETHEQLRGNLLWRCIFYPIVITIIGFCLFIPFYAFLSTQVVGTSSFILYVLVWLGIILQLINNFSDYTIRLVQKSIIFSVLQILNKAVFIFLFTVLFFFGVKTYGLIYSTLATFLIIICLGIGLKKDIWFIKIKNGKDLQCSHKELIKYGIPFLFSSIFLWLNGSVDRVILKETYGFDQVGVYSMAARLTFIFSVLRMSIDNFLGPEVLKAIANKEDITRFLIKMNQIFAFILFMILFVAVGCRDIFILLLGPKFHEVIYLAPFILMDPLMVALSETTVAGINIFKKSYLHIIIVGVSCIVNIILNLILVPKLGMRGCAIATASSSIMFLLLRTYFSVKLLGAKFKLFNMSIVIFVSFLCFLLLTWNANLVLTILICMGLMLFTCYIYRGIMKSLLSKAFILKDRLL